MGGLPSLGGLFGKKKKGGDKKKPGLFSGLMNKAKAGLSGLANKAKSGLGKIGGLAKKGLSGLKGLGAKGFKGLGAKAKGLGAKGLKGLKGLGAKAKGLAKRGMAGIKNMGAKLGAKLNGFKNSLKNVLNKSKNGKIPKEAPLSPAAKAAVAKGKAFCQDNCQINYRAIQKRCLDNGKLVPCRRCTAKSGKDANHKKVCELVCNANMPASPCDFYGYVNNKKKTHDVLLLNKYGLRIVRRKYK